MVYRLYVETVKQGDNIGWAYAFYNHQDFMVYKRFGKSETQNVEQVILEVSTAALTYFERSIRRRYYDEHFSTRIDEDYVTLFTHYPEIAKVAEKFKSGDAKSLGFMGDDKDLWEGLMPFFVQKTMMFENSTDERFIAQGQELAVQGLK
ncbi:MAG: hypothetical protein IJ002_04810 [Clostridia bacterium]|nr:hypothetical protein [Clostridia bacterium]